MTNDDRASLQALVEQLKAPLLDICIRIEAKPGDCVETHRERAGYYYNLSRTVYAVAENALVELDNLVANDELAALLQPVGQDAPQRCVWILDEHYDCYETTCGQAFQFIEGTPSENQMQFCCYCGQTLAIPSPASPHQEKVND